MELRPTRLAERVGAAPAALALVLVACAAEPTPEPDLAPWDAPVEGAVAVTGWDDHSQPAAPFGPGGFDVWSSPEELVASMAQALATSGELRSTGQVVERRDTGTVIGWVRLTIPAADEGADLAGDIRVEMRSDGGSWFVTRTEHRQHCAVRLVNGECR